MAVEERFAEIQGRLPDLWQRTRDPRVPRFVIAVPSLSLDLQGLALPGGLLHFEERMLYLFHLLGEPACRLWFHSSHLIPEDEISYYLHFLRHVPFSHARNRLRLQSLMDRELKPLTQKILQRPALLERLRRQIARVPNAYLSVYRSTELEMELAVELGVPIMGTDPRHRSLSGKNEARAFFRDLGIEVISARAGLQNIEDLAEAIVWMHEEGQVSVANPQVVVKQNQGVSGLGNRHLGLMAFWDLLSADLLREEKQARFLQALQRHWGDAEGRSFLERFERLGGVVENRVEGESVSVQLNITPLGHLHLVGVHQELLDARGRYLSSICPAPDGLASRTLALAERVGQALAERGIIGRVEVDFLVTAETCYALDLNLRKSNSTTTLRTLNLLAGGGYVAAENRYRSATYQDRFVYSSDWLQVGPQASCHNDVIDLATEEGLHYSTSTHTGVIFHMLGGVSSTRRLGVSCIGQSHQEAQDLYQQCALLLGPAPQLSGRAWPG